MTDTGAEIQERTMDDVKGVGARLRAEADRHATTLDRIDCGVCGNGRHVPSVTTVTLTRDEMTLVFRHVPADVCDVCGDDRIDVDIARRLERIAEVALADGVRFEIREYQAA